MTFTLLPAVDVANGQAVRLVRAEAGTETTYGAPRDAALAWQRDARLARAKPFKVSPLVMTGAESAEADVTC